MQIRIKIFKVNADFNRWVDPRISKRVSLTETQVLETSQTWIVQDNPIGTDRKVVQCKNL